MTALPKRRENRRTTGRMYQRYGIPPFSVLDTRLGWWQSRKKQWLALGIQGELGRGENGRAVPGGAGTTSIFYDLSPSGIGTSGFDPVLCELMYRWYCPVNGIVLDPFAGGSVRGILAAQCGRQYVGMDVRPEQVDANREQADRMCLDPRPLWHAGDSAAELPDVKADFVFTSPPYAGLEVYSADGRDLSTMAPEQFWRTYELIIAMAVERLREDRFACFVVGDRRGDDGCYVGLPWRTIAAFEAVGARLYNEAVLITPPGTVPIRMRDGFDRSRKFGKVHQNVLIFLKGDARAAAKAVGEIDYSLAPIAGDLFTSIARPEVEIEGLAAKPDLAFDVLDGVVEIAPHRVSSLELGCDEGTVPDVLAPGGGGEIF